MNKPREELLNYILYTHTLERVTEEDLDAIIAIANECQDKTIVPIETRKEEFKKNVLEISKQDSHWQNNPRSLYRFIDYFSEHSPKGRLMKFEKEKTFDIKLRLNTWKRNSQKFDAINAISKLG